MDEAPETLWIAWQKARDARAFETLVRPHLRFAQDLARRSGCSAADADDVVQESLVVLARERGDGPARAGVRAWLGRVVLVQAHTQRRAAARRARRERASGVEVRGSGGEEIDAREQVEAALAGLEPEEREAVVLRYLHDLDYKEIAFVLKASENACRIRVHRALERLRSSLGGGAAALIAAIVLPAVRSEAALLSGAVAAASTAPAAAGGLLLKTTVAKVVAAAVVASVATVTLVVATGVGRSGPVPSRARTAAREAIANPGSGDPLDATSDEMLQGVLAQREDAGQPGDTGLDVLRRFVENGADVTDLLWDYDRARAHIRPRAGPVTKITTPDWRGIDLSKLVAGGGVIEFGPGTFQVSFAPHESVESLEIRGAGMDRTTLLSADEYLFRLDKDLVHLRVADLTFDGGEELNQFLGVAGRVAAAIENVRFRNWSADTGRPSGSGGTFLLFRGCEFLGGCGDYGLDSAFEPTGDLLVACAECLFADLRSVVFSKGDKAVVQMSGCTFENSPLVDSSSSDFLPRFPVRVRGGQVHFGSPDLPEEERRKTWGAPHAAEAAGIQFLPAIPRCTVGDLLRLLHDYVPADGAMIGGIYVAVPHRGDVDRLWLAIVGPDDDQHVIKVELRNGRWERPYRTRGEPPRRHDPKQVARCKSLADLLRNLPPHMECLQADYGMMRVDGADRPVLYVGEGKPPEIVLDGQTGARLKMP